MARAPIPDSLLRDQIRAGRLRARWLRQHAPHAASATIDRATRTLIVSLTNGARVALPARLVSGLDRATTSQLASVEVTPAGVGLRWPALDLDLSLSNLLEACFGAKALLQAAGAAGGTARSPAKVRAARLNGKRGGRPRKAIAPQGRAI